MSQRYVEDDYNRYGRPSGPANPQQPGPADLASEAYSVHSRSRSSISSASGQSFSSQSSYSKSYPRPPSQPPQGQYAPRQTAQPQPQQQQQQQSTYETSSRIHRSPSSQSSHSAYSVQSTGQYAPRTRSPNPPPAPSANSHIPSSNHAPVRANSRASIASTAYGDLPVPKAQPPQELTEDEEILADGILAHEAGRLEEATAHFARAAALNNPNAMFMYGISLRHGWGCKEDPVRAFQLLQQAAESAVVDLNTLSGDDGLQGGKPVSVTKKELILAISELGVCFRHGWGVPKNKVTAAYYFEIAANLGDPDAQIELATCYQNGEGLKKDMHKAAKYFRLADAQGRSVMGNSWIFKSKYDIK